MEIPFFWKFRNSKNTMAERRGVGWAESLKEVNSTLGMAKEKTSELEEQQNFSKTEAQRLKEKNRDLAIYKTI